MSMGLVRSVVDLKQQAIYYLTPTTPASISQPGTVRVHFATAVVEAAVISSLENYKKTPKSYPLRAYDTMTTGMITSNDTTQYYHTR